ncbi:ribosome small subunit-dependent GTPase A [Paenibacillus segetis]|uniref:Small ribosomal subunit biogenesis GTPase RsgA n=1 Tax=Paenibacillus segetis TaxID=1325360 RepID=A0ABQ1Y9Z9_9BACL|nr:ribosome small subunit-dependent GTPase A [Paenibacillus segetis]GGH18288.1 putative ribosome biogenesis GTPase RsgA [Paenibacillus segetis]
MNLEILETIGWNSKRETAYKQLGLEDVSPGRIVADHGQKYRVMTERGEGWAEMSGRLIHDLGERSAYPAVGDWVAVRFLANEEANGVIHGVLPRSSQISRRAAGSVPVEQIVAANVDILFLVVALNLDFNLRRLERYLIMAWNSGALPIILLSKADLCDDPERYISEVEEVSPGVQVLAVSALENRGAEELHKLLKPGVTVALTGSSGSGKSTIVNWMSGQEMQRTQDIRENDSRGRHTTTHREMFILPQGAVMIDTPGMRELQLWDDEGGWSEAFGDITELAKECRFGDCRHEREAGCAVRAALDNGQLDPKRMDNYRRTQRELKFQSAKERKSVRASKSTADKRKAPRGKGEQRRLFEVVEWE